MSLDLDRIYNLLPATYRVRDAEQGYPLKALLAVAAGQVVVLEEDLEQLYDDQFIETCADWVVPYIGDLLGYRPLRGVTPAVASPRAEVADTIGLRQRKGTAAALEQLTADVTGWPGHVVEFFLLLCTTQYLNHLRPGNVQCPDLRRVAPLQLLGTAFERTAHSADVRRISAGRGRFNIPDVGAFLWRLQALRLTDSTARRVADGFYTFDPLGHDVPLFNPGRPAARFVRLTDPTQVPAPVPRRALDGELEALRQSQADGAAPPPAGPAGYFAEPVALRVSVAPGPGAADAATPIPPDQVLVCDLSTFRRPPALKDYLPRWQPGQAAAPGKVNRPIAVAVDPVLGRIAFPGADPPAGSEVRVQWYHGLAAEIGGGEYARPDAAANRTVARGGDVPAALAAGAGQASFVVEIASSATFPGDLAIAPAPQQKLTLRSADQFRPVIDGSVTIAAAAGAVVTLDGLLITGPVRVTGADAMTLTLLDCTLPPWRQLAGGNPVPLADAEPALAWPDGGECVLSVRNSICGRLVLGPGVDARVQGSVIDALNDGAGAFCAGGAEPAGLLAISRSTVVGATRFREIELAEDSIFTGTVTSTRRQAGCVRFCWLPADSSTPRRYRCQPELAAQQAVAAALKAKPSLPSAAQDKVRNDTALRVQPDFTSLRYGQPGYLQLRTSCADEIATGSEDESEMGVYGTLYQPQRLANARARIDEYLRFGLEAGVFLET